MYAIIDDNDIELLFNKEPIIYTDIPTGKKYIYEDYGIGTGGVIVPKGTIEKIWGHKIYFKNKPVKIC